MIEGRKVGAAPTENSIRLSAQQIDDAVGSCARMFDSGIFADAGVRSKFFQPSLVFVLINLNSLLQVAESLGHRISFADHIEPGPQIEDVTALVQVCRDAACHVGDLSGSSTPSGFVVVSGYVQSQLSHDGCAHHCEFPDDIAVYIGRHRLYLLRHLKRAFDEVSEVLAGHAVGA